MSFYFTVSIVRDDVLYCHFCKINPVLCRTPTQREGLYFAIIDWLAVHYHAYYMATY